VTTSNRKGAVAESAIVHAAVKLGIGVFKPLTDGERYDLIFDLRPRLLRIQCKWVGRHGDTVIVRCYSSRRTADGLRRRTYAYDEGDAIAAYCADNERCFLLPVTVVASRAEVRLRLAPARNNQRARVRWASVFELESLDWTCIRGP
jgi:hypothetical protein